MCYLAIKELANIAEDVIIVTSSLTKDMTGKEDSFRASAIRALCKITDTQMLAGIERYLKQAIVDKNPAVSSAALVSSLVRCCFDIEKLVYSMFYINQCMHKIISNCEEEQVNLEISTLANLTLETILL